MSERRKRDKNAVSPSDEVLMQAYIGGDYSAFETLYRRHARTVYGFLTKKLRNKEMIEDVFQATFLQLHRSRARYSSSLPFLPWLFTLCRNALVDGIRSQRRVQEEPHENIIGLTETVLQMEHESSERYEGTFDIGQWTKALSEKEREVLSLRFAEDFSFDEIGKRLQINSSNARKISQRAIQKLRSVWK